MPATRPRSQHGERERRAWPFAPGLLPALAAVAIAAGCAQAPLRGPLIFVTNVMDGTVTVIEPASGKSRHETIGSLPHNLQLSPEGTEVLATATGSSSITLFSARTGAKLRGMMTEPPPDIPPHQKLGAAAFTGKESCAACHKLEATGSLVNQVSYDRDGRSLWAIAFNPPSLWRLDRQSGRRIEQLQFKDHPFPTQPSNLVFTPDGSQMVVLHRRAGQGGNMLGTGNTMSAFDHDAPPGNKASLLTFHSPDARRELGRVVVPVSLPFKATFDPTGDRMYVAYRSSNKVAEIDVRHHKLLRMLTVGEGPTNAVIDRAGKYMFAPSFYDNPPDVIKLELETGLIRALLPAQLSPTTVDLDRDTGLLYVAINGTNRVLEVDTDGKGKILRWFPAGAYPLDILVVPESLRNAN